nr:MAG TPA: hypothetical protein [Caudoviricetes sp.]
MPYRKCIFESKRRSIAGYVTEFAFKKALSRGCKSTDRIRTF